MTLTQMNPKELAASAVVTHARISGLVCDRSVHIFLVGASAIPWLYLLAVKQKLGL